MILSMLTHGIEVMSVRHALLALLSEGPKYGLQLRQEFEAQTGEVWPLNVGQVYTTLQRLEREGLVKSDDGERTARRSGSGSPTRAGASSPVATHAARRDLPPRDELVIKVLVALSVPGVDVAELLQVHRRHLVEAMQQYTRLKEDADEDEVGLALVVDAELFRLEAVVRWLDAADSKRCGRHPGASRRAPRPPGCRTRVRGSAARMGARR